MPRFLNYTLFFVVLVLLQVFLLDNLNLSAYVSPLLYVAFLVVLPAGTPKGALLISGLVTGVIMDVFMGTHGLNTIASLATAFLRPAVVNITLGKDYYRESDTLLPGDQGPGRWLRYSGLLVLVHCAVFFMFEAMSFRYFGFTILRMLGSAAATTLLVWFVGSIYPLGAFAVNNRR